MAEDKDILDNEDDVNKNDDLDNDSDESPAAAEGVNRKKIIMILLPLLVVVGAAVGIYFSGIADSMFGGVAETTEEKVEDEKALSHREIIDTIFYDVPEIVVNLSSRSRKQGSLMRVKIALEIEKASDLTRIEEVLPRITDSFIVHLREIRPEELEGSAGVYRLKEELLSRVNRAVRPAKVYDIRFKQFEIH